MVYYTIKNNTVSSITIPCNVDIPADSTAEISIIEFRVFCETDDTFLQQVNSGDLAVTYYGETVFIADPPTTSEELKRQAEIIDEIEVDSSAFADGRALTYDSTTGKIIYDFPIPAYHTHVEADITDLDHDALKIDGVVVDSSNIGDGKTLVYDSTTGNLQYEIISVPVGSVAWGAITGTLSNQTDLQTALDGKAALVHTHVEADITDLDHNALKIQGVPVDPSAIADGKVLVYDSTTGTLQYEFVSDETAIGANVGVGGVGLYKQKVGNVLQFKNINAASSKVTVVDDPANNEVDIDVDESNIIHQGLSGAGVHNHGEIDVHIDSTAVHFLETSIDHTTIQNIGINTHDQIDSHIADTTSNPHMVTFADVGAAPTVHTHVEADITDLDHDALKIQGVPIDPSAIADGKVLVYDSTTGTLQYEFITDETVTGSNVGVSGVGLFKQKINNVLQFKNINAASSKITVVDDPGNNEVDIDVDESNIVHQSLSGAGVHNHSEIDTHIDSTAVHFLETSIDHTTIQNIGINTHDQIDAHISDTTSNPHMVTFADVGAAPTVHTHVEADITDLDHDAQKIKGVVVDGTDIADGRVLKYNSVSGNLEYEDESGIAEITHWNSEDEPESDTTSDSFQEKLQLLATIDTTGTFMLQWYAEARHQVPGDAAECRLQEDNTITHAVNRFYTGDTGGVNWQEDFYPFTGHRILDRGPGTYEFDIDYRSTDSGTTAEIRRARITLWRMS